MPCRAASGLTVRRASCEFGRTAGNSRCPPDSQDRQAGPSGLDRPRRRFGDEHEFRPHHPAQPDGQRVRQGSADRHPCRRDRVDGVRCVASLSALERKLDLADRRGRRRCGLRPRRRDHRDRRGGIGDADSRRPGRNRGRAASPPRRWPPGSTRRMRNEGGGPIFLGANCLGVVSHPGSYDSWFIPLERLPKPSEEAATQFRHAEPERSVHDHPDEPEPVARSGAT